MRYLGPVGPDGIWENIIFGPSVHEYGLRYIISDSFFFFFLKKNFALIKLELSQKEKKMVIKFELKEIFVKCFKFLLWLEKLIDFFFFFLVKERKSKFVFWFLWCGKRLFPRVEEKTTPCQINNEIGSLTNRQWCTRCFDLGFLSLKLRVKWRERERAKKKNTRPCCFRESWLN